MKTFRDMIAWQKGYQLVLRIYKYTADFPKSEEYGLKSELRRASVSYISNIAEGFKKNSKKEGIHYYNRSECSLEEVKCQIMVSLDLGYLNKINFSELSVLCEECGKLLSGWIKSQKQFLA